MSDAIICTIDSVRTRKQPPETLITIAVPQEYAGKVAGFLTRIGDTIGVAFAELGKASPEQQLQQSVTVEVPDKFAEGRELANKMHRDGYFRNPKLWDALDDSGIYTQSHHKKWIEQQQCVYHRSKDHKLCSGEVCAHHTPSAALPAAGKGSNPRKVPHWYTLPLCHEHHNNFAHGTAVREEKQGMVVAAVALVAERVKLAMKAHIGIEHLYEIAGERLADFEKEIGL